MLAIGILANAFGPVFHIQTADTNQADRGSFRNPVHISLQGATTSLAVPVKIKQTDEQ